jgi:excisionase family DNA binding protein
VPGDPERLLTPIQLAQRLQIGGSTVKRMVYANRIPVMRVGARGVLRFSWVDVIAALKPKPEPDKG